MDFSFKKIPLVLSANSKLIANPPDSGLVKKRKLSECSDTSNSNSISEKSSINEKFLELSLENRAKFPSSDDEAVKVEDQMSMHTITIPKPVRLNGGMQEEPPMDAPVKNEKFIENLIKMSKTDVGGISKYLNLDLQSKFPTLNQFTSNLNDKEKFKMSSVITSFLSTPFNFPFMRPDLLMNTGPGLSDSQGSCSTLSDSGPSKFRYREKKIGTLTPQQRQEKVDKYLDKKKARKGVQIRYGVRKDLADKRERHQGRFVKTAKMYSSDFMEKHKGNEKMTEESPMKNNSDITLNHLSQSSSSLGKRMSNSDLFDNSSGSLGE